MNQTTNLTITVELDREKTKESYWKDAPEKPVAITIEMDKEVMIGRHSDCALIIDDNTVSIRHALLLMCDDDGQAYIIDNGSLNGTFVNDKKIEGNDEPMLKVGDLISITPQFHFKVTDISFS